MKPSLPHDVKKWGTSFWTVVVSSLAFALFGQPVKAQDAASLVPDQAAVYLELSNPTAVLERLLADDVTEYLETLEPFRQFKRSDEFRQLMEAVELVESRLGKSWKEGIEELAGGGVVFALGDNNRALLIMQAKDEAFLNKAHDLFLEIAREEAANNGNPSPVKSKEYEGVMAYSVGKGEFHAIIGDKLLMSNSGDVLKAVIDLKNSVGTQSIAGLESWKDAKASLPANRVGWAFVNLPMFRKAGFAADLYHEKANNPIQPLILGGLNLVLASADYAAVSLTLDKNRFGAQVVLPRSDSTWPEAYVGIYGSEGDGAAIPIHPPRSIASLSVYRDLKAIWDRRDQLFSDEVLPNFTELETNISSVLFGNREFSTEVLAEIAPHIRFVVAGQDYAGQQTVPAIKIPAFALVLELNNPDQFAPRLLVAYQTVMGLINLGLGQQGQPQLIQETQRHGDYSVQTARFLTDDVDDDQAAHLRYNFSPSCVTVGKYFVVGSTTQLVNDIVDSIKSPTQSPTVTAHNVVIEFSVEQIRQALDQNREALVTQNMVDSGNSRKQAEAEIDTVLGLLQLFGPGKAEWNATGSNMTIGFDLEFSGGF